MYHCTTCGAPISANAPICFNCGETASDGCSGCFVIIGFILFLMFAGCCGGFL